MPLPQEMAEVIESLIEIARSLDEETPDDRVVARAAPGCGETTITAGVCRKALACLEGPHVLEISDDQEWQVAHPLGCSLTGEGGILDCVVHQAMSAGGIAGNVAPGRYRLDIAGSQEEGFRIELDPMEPSPLYVPPKKGRGRNGLIIPGKN